jgi:glycosyltransferase involved in cell wall biosynthesis
MRYSFVIPTYNKKKPLKKTLEALNDLSGYNRENYEVVLVDDGSPGQVFKYIKGINRNYRLNYIYLQRCDLSCRSRARNYGISAARGKYIVFIDDDIVINSDYLKEADRYFCFSDNLVIHGLRLHWPSELIQDTDIRELSRTACRDADTNVLDVRHMVCNSLSYNLAAHKYPWLMTFSSNLVVPRKLLLEINGFDENFKQWGGEDAELGYRLLKAGAAFVLNTKLRAFHQSHPTAPKGESNLDYLVEKCKDVFKNIAPETLFALYDIWLKKPVLLPKFKMYPGKTHNRAIVELRKESELQDVKNRILEYAKKKGTEVIVKDYCESTDLDIWVQVLEVKDALLSYFPQSLKIHNEKVLKMKEKILYEKVEFSFR